MDSEENEYREAQLRYIKHLEKKLAELENTIIKLENQLNSVKSKDFIVEPIINPYPQYPWVEPYNTPGTGTPDWTYRPGTITYTGDIRSEVTITTTNRHEAEENGY